MNRPTCATCPYWDALTDLDAIALQPAGKCLRRPPVLCDSRSLMLALYQRDRGSSGEANSPLTDTDAACDVWEQFGCEIDDVTNWTHPTTEHTDSCGEHPDFPAYIAALKTVSTEA